VFKKGTLGDLMEKWQPCMCPHAQQQFPASTRRTNSTLHVVVGGVMVRTLDREVVGSTPGQVAIKWLLLRWITVGGQVNHLHLYKVKVNSAFHPSVVGKSSSGLPGLGYGRMCHPCRVASNTVCSHMAGDAP